MRCVRGASETARTLIENRFPTCNSALLAGSVVRGEATDTSDLDLIVFDESLAGSYRTSFFEGDWPVELFAHNLNSYRQFFDSDVKRGIPSLPRMVDEGLIIKNSSFLMNVKKEAHILLKAGPPSWDKETVDTKRYFLTDCLDDFIGCGSREEGILIAGHLASLLADFYLRVNNQWSGASKWIMRALMAYDEVFAARFAKAFDDYYRFDVKEEIMNLTEEVLGALGGRLFEGYTIGNPK